MDTLKQGKERADDKDARKKKPVRSEEIPAGECPDPEKDCLRCTIAECPEEE